MRPAERWQLSAVRDEQRNVRKYGIARFNKRPRGMRMAFKEVARWRSWAQNRVRQFRLPLPVTLTSDTSLMDAAYVSRCVQKAASLRKHDAARRVAGPVHMARTLSGTWNVKKHCIPGRLIRRCPQSMS